MSPLKLVFCWVFIVFSTHLLLSHAQQLFYSGFKSSSSSSNNLTLSGIAELETNGLLKLTNDTPRLLGHAFHTSPIRLKSSPSGPALSFSTVFAIAAVPQHQNLGGHGMAFAMVADRDLKGALANQYLGLLNNTNNWNLTNRVFAIEFDTVTNVEFGDINDNHVGIDLNSMRSNASVNAGYYVDGNPTVQNLSLSSGKTILVWVDYDSTKTQIDVRLSPTSQKPNRTLLSYKVDLTPHLDEFMYPGFSASTGVLASSHYVMGWSFNVGGKALPLDLASLPILPTPKRSKLGTVLGASLGSLLMVIIVVLLLILGIWWYRNRDVIESWELHVGPHRFPYQELREATKGFSSKELIGFGGFGRVYRGTLRPTKQQVAVKRISHDSRQGLREFLAEIASIGQLRHRHLVQLLGWCRRRGDLLLVYDFMPNGSLDRYLFDHPKMVLSWQQRFNIIKGVASGLCYLHEGWDQTVIHRDVKAGNVLLDSDMNGKLGDFGLAKLYEHGANPTTTQVVGTMGYLAPELTKTGKPTTSSDVYAFGAFLLEVACGRRPIEPKALPEELILVEFVWDRWKGGAILDVVDPKFRSEYNEVEAVMVLKLGLMCSADNPNNRPSMRQVVRYLEGEVTLPEVILAPVGFGGKKGGGGGGGGGEVGGGAGGNNSFENYVHSYPSSYYEKASVYSSNGDLEATSMLSLSTIGSRGR